MEIQEIFPKESVQSKIFKSFLKATNAKNFWDKSGADLYKAIERRRMISDEPPEKLHETVTIIKGEINDVAYYELHPKETASNQRIFYIHGGAYVYRISRLHWSFLGKLVSALNCKIIVPLYPLAPEKTHEEALAFVSDLYFQKLAGLEDNEKMILMGDSAGGGLALVLAQYLKEKGMEQPEQIILVSPWLDVSLSNPDIKKLESDDPLLVRSGLIEAGKMYAGNTDTKDPKVSPIYGDITGLAAITLIMGSHDLLVADSRKLAKLAKEQDIPLHYIEADKMVHIYPIYDFPESRVAQRKIVEKIKEGK
jgi:acetyl esterase/lipase